MHLKPYNPRDKLQRYIIDDIEYTPETQKQHDQQMRSVLENSKAAQSTIEQRYERQLIELEQEQAEARREYRKQCDQQLGVAEGRYQEQISTI